MRDIDIVIAWVDGNEPTHQAKRLAYSSTPTENVHTLANANDRFESGDEIYFCIASILKYAPFVRNIFIVTDNQIPTKLKDFEAEGIIKSGKIRVVDHSEIFRDHTQYLPTFNSISISSAIWRITDLSEKFVYFNDDIFLNQPFTPENWFVDDKIVLRSTREPLSATTFKAKQRALLRKLTLRKPNTNPRFSRAQETAATFMGETKSYWLLGHTPHAARVSTLKNFYTKNPDVFRDQIKYRFRDHRQFMSMSFVAHLEAQAGHAHSVLPPRIAQISAHDTTEEKLNFFQDVKASMVPSGCIQDLHNLDESLRKDLYEIMTDKFKGFLPSTVTD